ncbi:hypothetical protein J2S80_000840 [Pseudoxanthomonas mexicana]|nr:hypothetical protein [Pseudoxanthomonas mexicana]
MKRKADPDAIRRSMSAALLSLSRVLENTGGVVVNPHVLKSSANSLTRTSSKDLWGYEVSGLLLRVDLPQNSIPSSCASPLTVQFDLVMRGECNAEPLNEITHLVLELLITSDTGDHVCAWHLDRHIGKEATSEAHPLYHLQHGGHAMKPHSEHLGRTMLLPAPRMGCPPFDAILAIDLVLSNFAGTCWQSLRDEPTYTRLLKESQERFWRPYWTRLASWWDVGPKDSAEITKLWPHLA